MRFFSTVFLIFAAIALTVATVRETADKNKSSWFGARELPVGGPIADFSQTEVASITLERSGGETLTFQKGEIGWNILDADDEITDRADAFRLARLVDFTLKSRILDSIPRDDVEPSTMGLGPQAVEVNMRDEDGNRLAHYFIGRKSPWVEVSEDEKTRTPSVYIRHKHQPYKNTIYVCADPTDGVLDLFSDRFSQLRDPRPFFFNPTALTTLRLKTEQGEVTLFRPSVAEPWKVTKPLELQTDPEAVKNLVVGLVQLSATELADTPAVTTAPAAQSPTEIAIVPYGETEETVLTITPPEAEATTTTATVSDRSAAFVLPLNNSGGRVGLNDLPLTLNQLRFKKLTSVSPAALKSISLTGPASEDILLARKNPREVWQVQTNKGLEITNESALFDLLSALSQDDVAGFVTDAAIDLAPYGLDSPQLTITILGFDQSGLVLHFTTTPEGKIYACREGFPNVYEVSPRTYAKISTVRSKWKDLKPWNLSRVDIQGLVVNRINQAPLILTYDFILEKWTADQEGKDVTADIVIPHANKFLESLENLKVTSWLAADNEAARQALQSPVFQVRILLKNRRTGADEINVLTLARASDSSQNQFFYGLISSEPFPFLLDLETVKTIAVPLLETD